jgi:His/Glu/Gln/Arg/opine family amino acid ABC transporter permease subunit
MNWGVVIDHLPLLARGLANTVMIAAATILLSVAVAVPLAVLRESRLRPVALAVAAYSWFARATPALAILFFAYYGLPTIGVYLEPLPAAVLGLSLSAAGYNLEFIRAGLRSVPAAQTDAARALGIPRLYALRRIIIPQAMRVAVPPLFSNLTLVLKGSALASLVAVSELTGEAMGAIATTYRPIEFLLAIAAAYLVLNTLLVGTQAVVERRLRGPR